VPVPLGWGTQAWTHRFFVFEMTAAALLNWYTRRRQKNVSIFCGGRGVLRGDDVLEWRTRWSNGCRGTPPASICFAIALGGKKRRAGCPFVHSAFGIVQFFGEELFWPLPMRISPLNFKGILILSRDSSFIF
jgi:hypothetical protein